MTYRTKPPITEDRIAQIRDIIAGNPEWNRTKISKHLCLLWDWRGPNNQYKDISCREMLRSLDKAGIIELPAARKPSRSGGRPDIVKKLDHDMTPVHTELSELRPLCVSTVNTNAELAQFKSLIGQYHYLGYDRSIGETMKYMVYSRDGVVLSCVMFSSAAWSCHDRDRCIGWNKTERAANLGLMTNNSRFLLLPWVDVKHLASHILSLIARRVAHDWQAKYGHPVYCLETFVEANRFRGTCYKAANWIKVGATTGRGRDGGHKDTILPIKDVYLYPLVPQFRETLCKQRREEEPDELR